MGSSAALAEAIEVEDVEQPRLTQNRADSRPPIEGATEIANPIPIRKLPRHKIDELVLDHREHGKRLAWSFLSSWRVSMNPDEVISVVGAALCEAANRFDPDKGVAFKTFFFYHLRGMLLKEIARVIQEQRVLQFVPHSSVTDAPNTEQMVYTNWSFHLVETNNPERVIEKRQIAGVCWEACSTLDELEQEVLVRYFVYDEPLVDIARELKYCRCHISRVKSRALAKVAKVLKAKLKNPEQDPAEPEQEQELDEHTLRRLLAAQRKGYTGGRGRRKTRDGHRKSGTVQKVANQACG